MAPQTARANVVETSSRRISMLDRLIESGATATAHRHVVPSGVIAVVAHAVIVAGAVWATLTPAGAAGRGPIPVTIDWAEAPQRGRGGDAPHQISGPPPTTIDAPSVPPARLPPIEPAGPLEAL